jgi:hypothetical protein
VPGVRVTIEQLAWTDPDLGTVETPAGPMHILAGFGSGLATRTGDPPGRFWAVCDRGPNLKVKTAVERYGLTELDRLREADGAKIMPRLDLGPTLAELRVQDGRVELVRTVRLTGVDGAPMSGIPLLGGPHATCEPAFDLQGAPIRPDPAGVDSEGVAACRDGSSWVGDEYGPSLLHVDAEGRVRRRLVPASVAGPGLDPSLPAIAARRQINRGFEALALSPDENRLTLAFQSPLAHPDPAAHERGRHVRIWQVDLASGTVAAQFVYPLDAPETFRRDREKGAFDWKDIKIGEVTRAGPDALLVLERGSETSKIYRVRLDPERATPAEHLDIDTRPTLEELSAAGSLPFPVLDKELLVSTDEHRHVSPDLEGMTLLGPTELLLVNDNDFGLEGARTAFWRFRFDRPLV